MHCVSLINSYYLLLCVYAINIVKALLLFIFVNVIIFNPAAYFLKCVTRKSVFFVVLLFILSFLPCQMRQFQTNQILFQRQLIWPSSRKPNYKHCTKSESKVSHNRRKINRRHGDRQPSIPRHRPNIDVGT